MSMAQERGESVEIPRGLYDHLVNSALRARIDAAPDPRLAQLGEVDAESAHAAIAQYLERLLAQSLSTLRGKDAAEKQRRLVDRVIETLVAELGDDWSDRFNLASPLRRLLAVHAEPGDATPRPDTGSRRARPRPIRPRVSSTSATASRDTRRFSSFVSAGLSPGGLAAPYAFLGPASYVSHEGSRPLSVIWRLQTPMPTRLYRIAAS